VIDFMDSPAGAGVCLVEMNSSSSTTTLTVKEDIPLLNKPRENNNVFNRFDTNTSPYHPPIQYRPFFIVRIYK
jgi:hypothetical protein